MNGQRNKERPKRSWDVEDWMGASVWRLGRTAEDRPMYTRSIKAATSGNGFKRKREHHLILGGLEVRDAPAVVGGHRLQL